MVFGEKLNHGSLVAFLTLLTPRFRFRPGGNRGSILGERTVVCQFEACTGRTKTLSAQTKRCQEPYTSGGAQGAMSR